MWAIAYHPTIASPSASPAAARRHLALRRAADGSFIAPIPAEMGGRWCCIEARLTDPSCVCTVRIGKTPTDASGAEARLSPVGWLRSPRRRAAIAYIPAEAASLRLRLFGHANPPGRPPLSFRPISYGKAALAACVRHPARAARALARAAIAGPRRGLGRLR